MGRFRIKNIRMPRINPVELGKQGIVIVLGSVIFGFGSVMLPGAVQDSPRRGGGTEKLSCEAYNESGALKDHIENYKSRSG
ncbi:MAG: hypothetical protein SVR04_08270 [Spirochaetota bacterium]|nr:hypothetical protein [Spirochaetota bacterium]